MNLVVFADGYLQAGEKIYKAVYGRGGIGPKETEGNRVSPIGVWPLRKAFYRADRLNRPSTGLSIEALTPAHAWCDVQGDPKYNQLVMLPHPVIDQKLWREDHLYDVVVVIGFNDCPVIDGKGPAIFLHVARPDYSPSAGCAALSLPDLLEIMPMLDNDSTLTFATATLKNEPVRWPYRG